MQHPDLFISVVVCTYNRAEILKDCLTSLTAQSANPANFEVVIVDNNSSDNTKEVCRSFIRNNENIRYTKESRQGLSHARNRGYEEARSAWVCYIDDDATAFTDYVERILYVIQNYDFDCFGGVYLPWYKYGKPEWYKDAYATKPMEREGTGTLTQGYVSGGVMVIKKAVLESLGGFSPDIGMSGDRISYGEEVLLQVQMRQKGMTIGFDPELKIYHLVNVYKLKLSWFLKSAYANGLDDWNTFGKTVSWVEIFKILPRNIVYLFLACVRCTPLLSQRDYYVQNWVIDTICPLTRSFGQLASGLMHIAKRRVGS
jgi:glycosyltransferase involved in cell wall biosynthesis